MNSRPPVKPAIANEPFKHVIDEYKHQAQTITCTCGWHGSSATIDRGGSEWTAHLSRFAARSAEPRLRAIRPPDRGSIDPGPVRWRPASLSRWISLSRRHSPFARAVLTPVAAGGIAVRT